LGGDWTIRPAHAGDERGLVELFRRSFGHDVSEAHWRWKFQQLSSPVPNDWLALDGERPIFHSGGIPLRYQIPTGATVAMVSVDTMTDPEYRRRGLLTQVAGQMYAAWTAAGIPFVIGLINDQWRSRAPALGWEPLFLLRWVIRPLRPSAIILRRLHLPGARIDTVDSAWNGMWDRRVPHDRSLTIRTLAAAGSEVDQVWQRCAPDAGISIVRDAAWVNWRYLTNPTLRYRVLLAEDGVGQPCGYAVYRLEHTPQHALGYVAEVLVPRNEPAVLSTLVAHVSRSLRAEGAHLVAAQIPPGTGLYAALRRAGFIASWGDFSVQLVPLASALPVQALRDPRNWTMWGGDYDSI
jgi:hypothetical protein